MKSNNDIVPVVVFCGLAWEAEMVKNLLENEEIEAFINDEFIGTIAPFYSSSGGFGSVKVVVSNLDCEKAQLIISEYENNRSQTPPNL